jgi:flagellar motor component MotA
VSTTQLVLVVVGGVVVLSLAAGFIGRSLVRVGLREPFIVRLINRASERVVDVIKRPITIAVLDEVADVLRTGHYTKNIAAALRENHDEIKEMVSETIKADPTTRRIGLLPFHDRLIDEVTETTLRVILELLADPRTDELVSDMLRDNITQIRSAVRARQEL